MYNTFHTPNLANFSPYELVFRRKPKVLLNLVMTPDIKVAGMSKYYHELLNKRLKYLHELLQNFKLKRLAMINKDRAFFHYNSGNLVYIVSVNMSITNNFKERNDQICRCHFNIKIIDLHNYLLMTLNGKKLRGLFKHERLKPFILRSSNGNVNNLSQLKEVINIGLTMML